MTELGRHREGRQPKRRAGIERRPKRAIPNGMERYAYFAENGHGGLDKSFGEAIVWYKKAAEAGQPAALTRMGEILGDKKLHQARGRPRATPRAMTALGETATGRREAACMKRPRSSVSPRPVPCRQGAGIGGSRISRGAGRDWANGSGGEGGPLPSMIKVGWLRQAADRAIPRALYLYGMSLPDKADGANWLRRAAEKGHARAMTETALRSSDAADRRRWFESAAKVGRAGRHVPVRRSSGDREWIRKAADKGYAPAMVALGEKDWLEKAAGAGYANAFTKLGQLERGAEMGDPEAKMLLGDAVASKKPRQAVAYYLDAAKTGYGPAMTGSGDCSLHGEGTSRSEIDALKWYREAHCGRSDGSRTSQSTRKVGLRIYRGPERLLGRRCRNDFELAAYILLPHPDMKPFLPWVPSQKGLFSARPQRQSEMTCRPASPKTFPS